MKDLDFDEIDRAVNSLNTNTPVASDGTTDSLESAETQPTPPVSQSTPLASRRSSGQFMDVVHPSSDMRRAPLMMPERTPKQNDVSTPNIDYTPPVAPLEASQGDVTPTNNENNWPDPIDFNKQNEDEDIDKISDDITNELNQKTNELAESPFISGTKVEKRPLGAFSDDSVPETEKQDDVAENKEAEGVDNPTPTDSSLPDELQDDLLKIESDDKPADLESEKTPEKSVENTGENVTAATNQPIGPTSITQQYKEQPSTGDQETGAVYDTDTYHKGLVVPTKKKSNWMWVLWIVLLLIVGAGVGAAVYYFVLPSL